MIVEETIDFLRSRGIAFEEGLSEEELARVEERFGFIFADTHRAFLSIAAPISGYWVDWRSTDQTKLQQVCDWQVVGTLFDVEVNGFWPRSWGERPTNTDARIHRARRKIAAWPRLVPLVGHRYIPAAPGGLDSPVFSVYQTDVIIYGDDLLDFVHREFGSVRTPLVTKLNAQSLKPWTLFAHGEEVK